MTQIPEEILERLAETVDRHLGLHFPRERWPDLVRGIEATCRELGISGGETCARELLEFPMKKQMVEIFGRHLTIGETYFFRDQPVFAALEKEILPPVLERRRREDKTLRLWSAACSTGEEPYSLAILLRGLLFDLERWKITVLATDINSDSLRRAENGVYREWSFRGDYRGEKELWFTRTADGRYRVRPEIRAMVTFAYHNLVDDPYPSLINQTNAMDVIFCRNVLMYFSESMRREVMNHLAQCLVDGGILVVGGAESALRPPPGLVPLPLPDAAFYRKSPPKKVASRLSPSLAVPPGPSAPPPSKRKEETAPTLPDLGELFARGEYDTVCRRAALAQPGTLESALMAARSCANLGKLKEALQWVDLAISRGRLNPEAHYLRAMILDERSETSAAREALRTTLYLDPAFIPAYVALGNMLRREGDRQQAERNFRNALGLLEPFDDDAPVPHSEEMRAGSMREAIIAAMGGADGS